MDKINLDKKTLRNFAVTVSAVLLIFGTFLLIKHKPASIYFYLVGIVLILTGFLAVNCLKPVYTVWMKLAFALSWFNTRLILAVIFYLLVAPIGLALRLFRVDLLNSRINPQDKSYWKKKESKDLNPQDYERQF